MNVHNIRELKGAFHLEVSQAVFVPSTTDESQGISAYQFKKRLLEVKMYLSRMFGGFSAFAGEGGWVSDVNQLVEEDVVKVVSFAEKKKFYQHKKALINQIKRWKKQWRQNSIGYELEGDMYYIE